MNSSWAGGQANGMYPAHLNQPVYGNLANPQAFDINQYSQSLQNGASSQAGTPQPQPFPNQNFAPGSVVPAKRPHDGMSGSPQQTPHPQGSRSHTPSYAGFTNQQPATPQFPNAPTPYQHLQQPGSNNATPSPTMQNQPFRPPQQQPPSSQQQPQQQAQQRMNNASPSPYPQQQPHQQSQQQQQHGNFGQNQMAPNTPQGVNQMNGMQQPGQMNQYNPQFGMNPNMAMSAPGMQNAMAAQFHNMQQPTTSQQAYTMKLLQQQQKMRQSGMLPPGSAAGQPGGMSNMAAAMRGMAPAANGAMTQLQAQQQKRNLFLSTCQKYVAQAGGAFNPQPLIGGKPVDLYALWSHVASSGGSSVIDRGGQWQTVASKMGFAPEQFPTAGAELRQFFLNYILLYERNWLLSRQTQKAAHAQHTAHQQMGGYNASQQQTPTKMMQPPGQQHNQFAQFQQQAQQAQQAPQSTPVQAHATLPPNGMTTPQQMTNPSSSLQHRRNSSLRKSEPGTPQAGVMTVPAASPMSAKQPRPATARPETVPILKSEEPQSTVYTPSVRNIDWFGGYNVSVLFDLGSNITAALPTVPTLEEMGTVDIRAITLSLASGIHSEVRYALDTLAILARSDKVQLRLEFCDDLLDVVMDCAEEQTDALSEDAAEVSDALDLPSYEDVLRARKSESESLQEIAEFGSPSYALDRAADKVIAITTILRELSFYQFNHVFLAVAPVIKWLSNTIRLIGTRNMLLRNSRNTQDFYKDVIVLLSNITECVKIPSRDDALHILHFLLVFAPQPSPNYTESGGKICFVNFSPTTHQYLPPAVDCLAKLLARTDPNRVLYRSIFNASPSSLAGSDSPLDLLTRAFALAISVLPDRSKTGPGNSIQRRLVELRKPYMSQGMLAADLLTSLAPPNNSELARAWIESEDGWAVSLLNLAALLGIPDPTQTQPIPSKKGELGLDLDASRLIASHALTMMKRLAEKASKAATHSIWTNGATTNGDVDSGALGEVKEPKWEGVPQGSALLGVLVNPHMDKAALGLLCGLHDLAMQHAN